MAVIPAAPMSPCLANASSASHSARHSTQHSMQCSTEEAPPGTCCCPPCASCCRASAARQSTQPPHAGGPREGAADTHAVAAVAAAAMTAAVAAMQASEHVPPEAETQQATARLHRAHTDCCSAISTRVRARHHRHTLKDAVAQVKASMRFCRASLRGLDRGSWLPVITIGFLKPGQHVRVEGGRRHGCTNTHCGRRLPCLTTRGTAAQISSYRCHLAASSSPVAPTLSPAASGPLLQRLVALSAQLPRCCQASPASMRLSAEAV